MITWAVEADFDRDGDYEVDLTDDVRAPGGGITIDRGFDEDGMYRAGRVTIEASNRLGTYSPGNGASARAGQLRAGVPIRVTATADGVAYTLWTGYIQAYRCSPVAAGKIPVCTFECQDLAGYLGQVSPLNVLLDERTTGEANLAIAAAAGLTADDYRFDSGGQNLPVHWARNADALSAFSDVQQSEMGGHLWVDALGRLRGQNRRARLGISFYRQEALALGPVGYWRLGEASGTAAADESGNGRTGAYVNTPTLGQAGLLTGDPALSCQLNGTDEFVSVADHATLDLNTLTVAGWLNMTSLPAGISTVIDKGTQNAWFMRVLGSGSGSYLQGYVVTAGPTYDPAVQSPSAFTTGVHHVALTYDGATLALYIDGAAVHSVARSGTLLTNNEPFYIGTAAGGAQPFPGYVQDWALWSRALTAAEVRALYLAGHSGRIWGDGANIVPREAAQTVSDRHLISKALVQTSVFTQDEVDQVVFVFSRNARNPTPDSMALAAGGVYAASFDFPGPVETLTTPEATTDYTANTAIDGTGTDRTANLSVTVTLAGAGFDLELQNTHATDTIYVTKLELRGLSQNTAPERPMFKAELAIPGEKLDRGLSVQLPFADDSTTARDYAQQLLSTYRYEYPQLVLTFDAGRHADAVAALLDLDLGDLVRYTDTALGAGGTYSDDWWYVQALRLAVPPGLAGETFEAQMTLVPSYLWRNLDAIAFDGFDRDDAVGALGTSTQGGAWADDAGMDIVSGTARPNTTTGQVPGLEVGAVDVAVQVSLAGLAGDSDEKAGVVYRRVDASNWWRAYVNDVNDKVVLNRCVGGSVTAVATADWTPTATAELRVIAQGDRHRVWLDRRLVIDVTSASSLQGTGAGLYAESSTATLFDDFVAQGV